MKAKDSVQDLALFGGSPLFENLLHVGRPNIGDRSSLHKRLDMILDRAYLSNMGPMVQELESKISKLLDVKHAIAVANATIGLEVAARGLGLTGEVIVPSFTFIATAHFLKWMGLEPVFCDIRAEDHCIDPNKIEKLITKKTSAIVGVHLWGNPAPVEQLSAIASKHGLKLLFDSAHAFKVSHQGKMIGGFGDAEVLSLHATKVFNSAEGGIITTNDDALATRIRRIQSFGFTAWDKVEMLGTNAKMNELSAALGLTNLEELDTFIGRNLRNYRQYKSELAGLAGTHWMTLNESEAGNFQYVVVEVGPEAEISRDLLLEILQKENVLARRYFYPGCHRMEPYASEGRKNSLPVTERVASQVLVLPSGSGVTPQEISKITSLIRFAIENAKEICSHSHSKAA